MLKETLSITQANEVLNQYQNILNDLVEQLDIAFNDFFNIIEKEWQDEYFKRFLNDLINKTNEIIDNFKLEANKFIDKVNEVEQDKENVLLLNIKHLKNDYNFDLKNNDNKKFKNKNSKDIINQEIIKLEEKINLIITNTTKELKKINVFGNESLIQELMISSGKIIEDIQKIITVINNDVKKYLEEKEVIDEVEDKKEEINQEKIIDTKEDNIEENDELENNNSTDCLNEEEIKKLKALLEDKPLEKDENDNENIINESDNKNNDMWTKIIIIVIMLLIVSIVEFFIFQMI